MNKQVSFLGLGLMGGPMAANLAQAGVSLSVWNRTPGRPGALRAEQAGATVCDEVAAAVVEADIIFTCLGGADDVYAVLLSARECLRPGCLVIDTSTIGPKGAMKIAAELADWSVRFMDAPVSGGDTGAQQGTLTFMVGGAVADFEEAHPLFEIMGRSITRCGEVGAGQSMKLCNQLLCAVHKVAFCEAFQLAQKKGLDPQAVIDVCGSGAASSWVLNNFAARGVSGDFAPGFMVTHMLKDIRLVLEAAAEEELNVPAAAIAHDLFERVAALEGGAGAKLGTQAILKVRSE